MTSKISNKQLLKEVDRRFNELNMRLARCLKSKKISKPIVSIKRKQKSSNTEKRRKDVQSSKIKVQSKPFSSVKRNDIRAQNPHKQKQCRPCDKKAQSSKIRIQPQKIIPSQLMNNKYKLTQNRPMTSGQKLYLNAINRIEQKYRKM